MPKKATRRKPAKSKPKRKDFIHELKDFSQNALSIVERITGEKLVKPKRKSAKHPR